MISPTAAHERTVKVVESLVDPYTAWHEAEPDPPEADYAAQAARWRAKLPHAGGPEEPETPKP